MGGRGGSGHAHSGGTGTATAPAAAPARAEPDNGEPAQTALAAGFRKQRTSTTEKFPAMTNAQKNAILRTQWSRSIPSSMEKELKSLGMFSTATGMLTEKGLNWFLGRTSGDWQTDIHRFE